MPVTTLYSLAEAAFGLIEGGDPKAASSIDFGVLKNACKQVINKMLKAEYISVNLGTKEIIPNGSMLATYENRPVEKWNDRSRVVLPAKPVKLIRDIGTFSVYPSGQPDKEYIPIEMGQSSLLVGQPLINDMLGQVTRQTLGMYIVFNKDLTAITGSANVDMHLIVVDTDKYGDYDPLPVPADFEWDIVSEVYKLYSTQPIPDKLVDSTVAENKNIQLRQQRQS